jgi:hypothetical protein
MDLIVAVGLCATVFGGYLLFMAASGTLGAPSYEALAITPTPNMMDATQWVQPALGQAIVQDYLLERETARKTAEATAEFNRATMAGHRLESSPLEHVDRIRTHAAAVEADHVARVQLVLGRRIVDFTQRGVRAGVLSPTTVEGPYNHRMIRLAELNATRMEEQFRSVREPMLGWDIVMATQEHDRFTGQLQHRIGNAIVQVVHLQRTFQEAMAGAQEQLASVVLASIQTEQITDRFSKLAAAELSGRGQPVPFTEPRSWPDIPVGLLVAASATLIGLFFAGLSLPIVRREPISMGESQPESVEPAYRKTA